MNISIIGYDLRALSLARLLIQEGNMVNVIPGFNHEIFTDIQCYKILSPIHPLYEKVKNTSEIVGIVKSINPDLVICLHIESCEVGLVEKLRENGFLTFGINRQCALLETSKQYGISFAQQSNLKIPSSFFVPFEKKKDFVQSYHFKDRIVVKVNGLAGGTGTHIIENQREFINVCKKINEDFIIQEFVEGEEVAFSLLISGEEVYLLNINFEVKREFDGDKGANTSGMGTVARNVEDLNRRNVINEVLKKLPKNLFQLGYNGAIDVNFIINKTGEFVFLEFTCRFGDPELSSELLLMDDITHLFTNMALNKKLSIEYKKEKWALGVVARNLNKIISSSKVDKHNYIIDMLDFGEYDECCISAIGDDYFHLAKTVYKIFDDILPTSAHFRTDIHESIEKRWEKLEFCKE